MSENPIFITGLHKSGTTLVRSLLDGHPELQTIPFESHFFPLSGAWTENEYQRSQAKSFEPQRLLNYINEVNTTRNPYGDHFATGLVDFEVFREKLVSLLKEKEAAYAYFEALRVSLYREVKGRMVEKSIENFEFFHEYQALFPGARFIHIIRNPYDNLVSLRKFKQKSGRFPMYSRLLPTIRQHYFHLEKNSQYANYRVVRYEDLLNEPKKTITDLVNFLGLEWHDCLMNPTIMGRPWKGNSVKGIVHNGLSAGLKEAWKNEITPFESMMLTRGLDNIIEKWGYEPFIKKGTCLTFAPGESFTRYLHNRLFHFYWRFYEAF